MKKNYKWEHKKVNTNYYEERPYSDIYLVSLVNLIEYFVLHLLLLTSYILFLTIVFNESPKALVDDESIKYLRGAEIEWQKEAFSGQMVVNNPGAKMGCGCGSSFMYDLDLVPTNS